MSMSGPITLEGIAAELQKLKNQHVHSVIVEAGKSELCSERDYQEFVKAKQLLESFGKGKIRVNLSATREETVQGVRYKNIRLEVAKERVQTKEKSRQQNKELGLEEVVELATVGVGFEILKKYSQKNKALKKEKANASPIQKKALVAKSKISKPQALQRPYYQELLASQIREKIALKGAAEAFLFIENKMQNQSPAFREQVLKMFAAEVVHSRNEDLQLDNLANQVPAISLPLGRNEVAALAYNRATVQIPQIPLETVKLSAPRVAFEQLRARTQSPATHTLSQPSTRKLAGYPGSPKSLMHALPAARSGMSVPSVSRGNYGAISRAGR
jgi:hypothetical protein